MSRGTLPRLGAAFALAALTSFAVATGVALVIARVQGYRWLSVLSGSMSPELQVGDLILDEPAQARELRPGEVVTFRDPTGGDRLITHRVRSAVEKDGVIEFVTKGDRNNAVERWQMPADGEVGRVVGRISFVGRLVTGSSGRTGRVLLLMTILAWAGYEWLGPAVSPRAALRLRRRVRTGQDPAPEEVGEAGPADSVEESTPGVCMPPVRVQRRTSATGVIVICRQQIRLGRGYAGRIVSADVSEETVTVELDGNDVLVVQRTTTLPVRRVNASRARAGAPGARVDAGIRTA